MGLKFYLRGLGVGIVVTALIMGIATSVNSKEILSDDEIRERAKGLGMVEESTVLADTFAQGSAGSPDEEEKAEPVSLSSPEKSEETKPQKGEETSPAAGEEEATQAPEGGEGDSEEDGEEKTAEPSVTPRATTEPSVTPRATTEPSETPAPTAVPTETPSPAAASTPAGTPTAEPAEISAAVPTPEPAASEQQGESVTIQIVSGDSSLAVCKKLAQAGLVESANEYDSYLCQNGYDKRIRAGSFEIPVGAGKDEIAGIILKLN